MIHNNFIRHFASVLLGCLLCTQAYAQHTTEFLFSETAPDYTRKTMQTNARVVFAEINRAYDANKSGLSLSTVNATAEAINRIQTLWATSHFYCTETGITTRVLKSTNSYQVRNVPVFFAEGKTDEDKYQDVVLEFTTSGKISDMYIAIAPHQYAKIMGNSNTVEDFEERTIVADIVEQFRTAYNTKDMSFLQKIYSDDALIITGKVVTQQKRGDMPMASNSQKIQYSVQSKKSYLTNLQRVFNNNSYINIKFTDVVVTRHEGNPSIYGVTLKQDWNTKPTKNSPHGYHDEGWLFLIFDFEDKENPQIWVRTWQPLQDGNGNPVRYSNENIFNLSDFKFR
ncbi:MAG: nuclear transport factor 2 family protein [Dysgonamonadaceae bacterium]|jgi:hypothetical protein|nr:nuclear transport factor 2 family protein [Dysgonamonadaceae bacterium]